MVKKSKVEDHSLRIENNVLNNPKFYDLLNKWIWDYSKGNVKLSSYYTYSAFCSTFSVNTIGIADGAKFIQESTLDGYVFVGIYRTKDGITVCLRNHIDELEIIEDKN